MSEKYVERRGEAGRGVRLFLLPGLEKKNNNKNGTFHKNPDVPEYVC